MSPSSTIVLISVGLLGFFAGSLITMHSGLTSCHGHYEAEHHDSMLQCSHVVEPIVQQRLLDIKAKLSAECDVTNKESHSSSTSFSFPSTMSRFMVGMARTDKLDFVQTLDLGVPVDDPSRNPHMGGTEKDVLLLYQKASALPEHYDKKNKKDDSIPSYGSQEAIEHCDFVNVVLTDHSAGRNQCWAIVPQYESYHVQKWMRVDDGQKLSSDLPLKMVSRGMKTNGHNEFDPPLNKHMDRNIELLQNYFKNLPTSLDQLRPLVEKVATPSKTVTVMVTNFGQSELLVNHVCAAKSRNLDISSILVFATDVETKELAEELGLTVFYDEPNFGEMPKEAAGSYGDRKFTAMMLAKVFCVHMVSRLKYNILFQDVDIVWYKNPIPFFETTHQDFDLLFQDDGGHSIRYAPYSANSGFYFVRYNQRTEYFFHSLLLKGDLIISTDSHQQALIATLNEHVSLFGLRAKVFSRDTPEFPGGYQYHQASGAYMRQLFAGEVDPFIFHMSWTLNKDNKLLFLRQMGEWYVQDQCVHKTTTEIGATTTEFLGTCCSAEPLVSCHYRDKPSKIPCKDSPPIDKGKPSFWK